MAQDGDDRAAWAVGLDPLDVQVTLEAPQELNHSSFALAGVFDLLDAGLLGEVRVRPSVDLHRGEVHVDADGVVSVSPFRAYKSVFVTITSHRAVRAVIDFRDSAAIFPVAGVQAADVLFKRAYWEPCVAPVVAAYGTSIEPAGLSLAATSPADRARMARAAGFWATTVRQNTHLDREAIRRLVRGFRAALAHQRAASAHPPTSRFRARPHPADSRRVFYQKRTFERDDDADAVAVNDQRAAFVRALRGEFGPAFCGGLLPTEYNRRRYPDCLLRGSTETDRYRDRMARAGVVVSTRGLAGSSPWSLAEYLGLGRCIVSEELRDALPAPPGGAISTFSTVGGCVAECQRLVADDRARASAAEDAHAYYRRWVDPAVAMHRMITHVIGLEPR